MATIQDFIRYGVSKTGQTPQKGGTIDNILTYNQANPIMNPTGGYPGAVTGGPVGGPMGARPEDFYGALKPPDQANPEGGSLNWYMRRAGAGAAQTLGQAGQQILPIGFSNLASILAGQGQTDPRALNMQLTDISRSGQAQQQGLKEMMAQLGLGSSGVAPALSASIGQGTAQNRSQAIAQENQLAEQRKRQDLGLLMDLILGPSMNFAGMERGYQQGQDQMSAQKQAAAYQAIASIASAAAGACWVAREVYGIDNPRWLAFRAWMLTKAPASLRERYMTHGPSLARFLREHPNFKPWMRRSMDRILEVGDARG